MDAPMVLVHLATKESFWDFFFDDRERRGIFVPHLLDQPMGASVLAQVIFLDSDARFKVAGTVLWRRLRGRGQGKDAPGSCLAFAPDEAQKVDRLVAYAEGKDIRFIRRTAPRLDSVFHVTYRSTSAVVSDLTRDVSASGLFLQTTEELPMGSTLTLKLRIPGRFWPFAITGEVVRQEAYGVGIRFTFSSAGQHAKLEKIIERLAKRVKAEMSP
jgi:Tfp pilus assembly protein PilZ